MEIGNWDKSEVLVEVYYNTFSSEKKNVYYNTFEMLAGFYYNTFPNFGLLLCGLQQ